MARISDYVMAGTLDEALLVLNGGRATHILAGGTDLLLKVRNWPEDTIRVVDVSRIEELTGITVGSNGLRIGAATRLADLVRSDILKDGFAILAQGARMVGSNQIRHLATLGGNLCNAAPSADTAAPMLALDASAEILSVNGRRIVAITDFFKGPGKTILNPGEILSALLIPHPAGKAAGIYLKHSPRQAMDLAVAGAAVLLARRDDALTVRIALSAVAPTPIRAFAAEQFLVKNLNHQEDEKVIQEAARLAAEACAPISDVRASAEYRCEMVRAITAQALQRALAVRA